MNYTQVSKTLAQTYTYKHISAPGLTDVVISIYTGSFALVTSNQPMTELAPGTGVYIFNYTPLAAETYTGIMKSTTGLTRSVIDAVFTLAPIPPTGSVVISNSVGVGHSN